MRFIFCELHEAKSTHSKCHGSLLTSQHWVQLFIATHRREEIVDFNLAFNHLIICTTSQCQIFALPHLKSPRKIALKYVVTLIAMSSTNFVLANAVTGISVHSYDGRLLSTPRIEYASPGIFSKDSISVTSGTLAVIDQVDSRVSDHESLRMQFLRMHRRALIEIFLGLHCSRKFIFLTS